MHSHRSEQLETDAEADSRMKVEGQIMALTIMGAERDANPVQLKRLREHLPRLLRQYRHDGDTYPVMKAIQKIMFMAWEPHDPQIREHITNLKGTL